MPNQDVRLLSLDGGGIRGLSALMILRQLMETINPDAPPKPCDYFDMIGGTSTGGLIAIMLGRLKMGIDDCIKAYIDLSDQVFQKKRHRVTVKGKIQGRFDSAELERAVKEVIKAQGFHEDDLLKDAPHAPCKVFVCATSKETSDTVCLTSYKSPRGNTDLLNSVKIWEACRATSAASSFFDPIAIGQYKEEFVDGATGANNPVVELWNQAQLMWRPEPLERKVQCLISIGTGIPSLKPFRDDVLHIGETLVAIATQTEQTAERFRRDKTNLDNSNRFFRFNVVRGLEDIGLEESAKVKEIAAATRRYVDSEDVFKQMQTCAGNLAGREYVGDYQTNFSLGGVPRVKTFIDRPTEIAELEGALLPRRDNTRQKIFVLRGLGGIGKTQLAVEFARRHHRKFSSVFWLDGTSEVSLKISVARCASRIPAGQISEVSKTYSTSSEGNINEVVAEVMAWLAQPDNTDWLVVFDNVDRDFERKASDPLAYDVRRYFTGADHGSILITTRLARLEQLGLSRELNKVDRAQGQAILESWYKRRLDPFDSEKLLIQLDGLPLAIAQAGAYLEQSGIGLRKYLEFYDQRWDELMQTRNQIMTPLDDYPNRSIWTTWSISYISIREQDKDAANLLRLWSLLDNKDLWFGLFTAACSASARATTELEKCIGNLARDELKFTESMQLLRNYSLVENLEEEASYATHPVVHTWARHYPAEGVKDELACLALMVVGWAVPHESTRDYSLLQRRLLPHAQACTRWMTGRNEGKMDDRGMWKEEATLQAIHLLGVLYTRQGKLGEAEQMLMRALQGKEEALGPKHTSTLNTINNLGILYSDHGKLGDAEKMLIRALQGFEETLGPNHISTLGTINNLGIFYSRQGKLGDAEKMYMRALQGFKEALGPKHNSTLTTIGNLGLFYSDHGKLVDAGKMLIRALQGFEETLGPNHTSTLNTISNLGLLYSRQGKLGEAEKMFMRALQGFEEALGPKHTSTLNTIGSLGLLYGRQGKLGEAEKMLIRALQGFKKVLGPNHTSTLDTINNLGILYRDQGKLGEAEKRHMWALQGFEEALGPKHPLTLNTIGNLGVLYSRQSKLGEAEKILMRALQGFEEALGPKHTSTLDTVNNLGLLYSDQGKLGEAKEMYMRALQGFEEALGPKHPLTLNTIGNLGVLYSRQSKLGEAEKILMRALQGFEEALGPKHTSTLDTVNNLGVLYSRQGKLGEAEKMYMRALQGKEEALGPKHTSTLNTINNLGILYSDQGKLGEAEKMYMRALQGKEEALGLKHTSTLDTVNNLGVLYSRQGKLGEAEKMYIRALQGKEEALGPKHTSTLNTIGSLGLLYGRQGKLGEAEKMLMRALQGFKKVLGPNHTSTLDTINNLGILYRDQGKLGEAEKMYMQAKG